MTNFVFVYGTLREGCGNHERLLGRKPNATIIAELPYRMVSLGGFPGLVPSELGLRGNKLHQITGELYEVTPKQFKRWLKSICGCIDEYKSLSEVSIFNKYLSAPACFQIK